jgi:two-component system, OmpR family, phosphate regulon sensor histidine kinase PhoR
MMKRLQAQIAVSVMLASAVALIAAMIIVWPGLRDRSVAQTEDSLFAEARLVSRVVAEPLARGAGPEILDPLVDETARDTRSRITVIAPDGRVLGDSSLSGPALLALENHRHRPEVEAALATGTGASVRHSTTVEHDLVYAAVVVRKDGRTTGIVRAAREMDIVVAQAGELRRGFALALVLAFTLALALSAVFSASWAAALREMMQAARRIAAGDLSARATVQRRDEIGELGRILNQAADELQRRIDEVARSRARTEAILAAMEEGVLAVGQRGNVLMASASFRRDFGANADIGRHYLEVVRQREIGDLLETVLRTGFAQHAEVEVRPRHRVYAITVVPFPEEGDAAGAVATFHEVTERRRIDQIRRDFVANASHELRTPLTSIRGFVEALEDGAVENPATAQRFLGKIRTHADRMAVLMDDLLELSRLESGGRPPQLDDILMAELLEDVETSFAPTAARKPIRLVVPDPGPIYVRTDSDRLRRILECLVDNAIKYTPAGGEVQMSARSTTDDAVEVDVRDNGPGIPAEHLPRLFERFYRVDKARSRELGGTGLGLSIAKHLAEGMGARLSVTSEVGLGSCFTVTLRRPPL